MNVKRKIIQIDDQLCDGCGLCAPSCAEGAIEIVDGKAKVISDNLCDGLGACIGDCPTGALKIIEREADDFDEAAVDEHLKSMEKAKIEESTTMPCGCPSTTIQNFAPTTPCQKANQPATVSDGQSSLTHWPVQIQLIPPTAPFLKGADLLVMADCVPIAFPDLHAKLLKDKKVMIGCPKFDDAQMYIQRFKEIFATADVKSVTIAIMEVPCCTGLGTIVKKGMELSGKNVPIIEAIISTKGDLTISA